MDAIDQAGNAPTETEGPHQPKPSARRRKKTETEKEALRQKRLREKFGEIGVDPDEPPLPTGISINAVRFAYSEVSQLARRRKRVNAGVIAERVAHGCKLGSEVRDGLCEWIEWLRSRRYLLRDGQTSPVLRWISSDAPPSAAWNEATAAKWTASVYDHPLRSSPPEDKEDRRSTTSSDALASTRPPANSDAPDATPAGGISGLQGEWPRPKEIPPAEKSSSHASSLLRPPLPFPAFVKGDSERIANAFFWALDKASDQALIQRARDLAADVDATRRAMERSHECRDSIIRIFRQLGLPIPGAKP